MVWPPVLGIFNMCTDVKPCNCTWGCTDTQRESALKLDPGRKILLHWGLQPTSVLCLGFSVGCSTSWAISTPWYKEKDHQLRSCSPGCRYWNWLGDRQHIWQWSPSFPAAWHQGSIPGCCSCSRSRPCPCFSQGASGQAVAPASEPGNTDRHWPSAGGDRLFIYSSVSDCSCF